MEKVKSFKFGGVFSIIKACLLGIIVTLMGVVLLAVVLKFTDLSSDVINYVNSAIKILALFIMVMYIKNREGGLLVKSIFGGVLYALLSFVIFSILNGSFAFNLGVVYDVLFAVIVSIIASVVVKVTQRA